MSSAGVAILLGTLIAVISGGLGGMLVFDGWQVRGLDGERPALFYVCLTLGIGLVLGGATLAGVLVRGA